MTCPCIGYKIPHAMRTPLLLSLVVLPALFPGRAAAQTYPVPDSGAVWSVATSFMGVFVHDERFATLGDTVIGGNTYRKVVVTDDAIVDPQSATYYAALREEDGVWYGIDAGSAEETVRYDFTAEVGETIMIDGLFDTGTEVIITAIDSIELADGFHTRWAVNDPVFMAFPEYWVEGIGSLNGPFYAGLHVTDMGMRLLCFKEQDLLIYLDPFPGQCALTTSIDGIDAIADASLFPNPITGTSLLVVDNGADGPLQLEVHDAMGRCVLRDASINGRFELRRASFPPGLFTYRAWSGTRSVALGRFIVE